MRQSTAAVTEAIRCCAGVQLCSCAVDICQVDVRLCFCLTSIAYKRFVRLNTQSKHPEAKRPETKRPGASGLKQSGLKQNGPEAKWPEEKWPVAKRSSESRDQIWEGLNKKNKLRKS